MTATSGDWLRRAAPALLIVVSLGLAACGGSDSEPDEQKTSATPTATPDQAALDQQAVQKLAQDIWTVRQKAYNSGTADPAMFEGIYSAGAAEVELGTLRGYQKQKIVRTGAPVITEIEARITGDTGMIYLCLSEDDWDATEDGEVLDTPARGANPWGASVKRDGDGWVLVQDQPTAEVEKVKSC